MSVELILDIVTAGIWTVGGLLICARTFSKGNMTVREILAGLLCSCLATAGILCTDIGIEKEVAVHGVEALCIVGCSIFFRKVERRMALFIGVFYELAVYVVTFLFGAGIAVLTKDTVFLNRMTFQGEMATLIAAVLTVAVSCVIYKTRGVKARTWTRLGGGAAILAIMITNALDAQKIISISRDDIDVCMYFAIGLFLAAFVLQMNKQVEMEKELADMKAQEAELLEREYHSLSQSYESNAKLFHDFRNHCGVLKNYLMKGKSEDALKYLEDLTGEGRSFEGKVYTGDETVDYLIGSKKALAEEKEIAFDVQVEFPRNMNIKSSDLCAILGNLLDNALEACVKVEDVNKRKVRLVIRRIQQMLVIKVENTYNYKPVVKDGNFQTSKTDGGLHGWGIKSAKTAAEKYDGMIQTNCTDQAFTTVVTLSFEGVKVK